MQVVCRAADKGIGAELVARIGTAAVVLHVVRRTRPVGEQFLILGGDDRGLLHLVRRVGGRRRARSDLSGIPAAEDVTEQRRRGQAVVCIAGNAQIGRPLVVAVVVRRGCLFDLRHKHIVTESHGAVPVALPEPQLRTDDFCRVGGVEGERFGKLFSRADVRVQHTAVSISRTDRVAVAVDELDDGVTAVPCTGETVDRERPRFTRANRERENPRVGPARRGRAGDLECASRAGAFHNGRKRQTLVSLVAVDYREEVGGIGLAGDIIIVCSNVLLRAPVGGQDIVAGAVGIDARGGIVGAVRRVLKRPAVEVVTAAHGHKRGDRIRQIVLDRD